jgi:hypothetical protein
MANATKDQIVLASSFFSGVKAPKLSTLAQFIADNMAGKFSVKVDSREFTPCGATTQSGVRLNNCKSISGKKIIVTDKSSGKIVFTHDSTERYSSNRDVCYWIKQNI